MDFFNVIWALIISFFLTCAILLALVPFLRKKKAGQQILCYVLEHSKKQGTPTMGGIAFVFASIIVAICFFDGSKTLALLTVSTYFAYAVTGFLDDFIKLRYQRNLGLKAYQKLVLQIGIAVILAWFCYENLLLDGMLILPFSRNEVYIGVWIVPLIIFVFLAMSNGVNLTDGLDGLATSTSIVYLSAATLFLMCLASEQLSSGRIIACEEYSNLAILCVCTIGALVAFLLFNCYPAKIFMGDTGSLAIGALCASLLILSKLTLLIPFLGVMFVVSCFSVVVQVLCFKATKKRAFLMAPYHHHLQHKGISETRISVLYSTITGIVSLLCLVFWL